MKLPNSFGDEANRLLPDLESLQARLRREEDLSTAKRAVSKLRAEGGDADFTPSEATALEAIVLLTGRPAILIADGSFLPPPSDWEILEQHRDQIEANCRSVGRIEVRGHPNLVWVGTGFLV